MKAQIHKIFQGTYASWDLTLQQVIAQVKCSEVGAASHGLRNASMESVCAQVEHLKPTELTELRRYLPNKLVAMKVQLPEK